MLWCQLSPCPQILQARLVLLCIWRRSHGPQDGQGCDGEGKRNKFQTRYPVEIWVFIRLCLGLPVWPWEVEQPLWALGWGNRADSGSPRFEVMCFQEAGRKLSPLEEGSLVLGEGRWDRQRLYQGPALGVLRASDVFPSVSFK